MFRNKACVFFHAFPPNIAVIGQRHIGENHIFVQRLHAVGVGLHIGARRHAKITRFGVDGTQAAVGLRFDPSDIVANGGHAPAIKASRGNQHREVGFAASRRESRCHMVFFACRVGHAQHQHVLGQPALLLPHGGCNAQRQAFFTQQGIATVT